MLVHKGGTLSLAWTIWASSRENLSSGICEQQRTDQPEHLHSLICAVDILVLERIISKLANSEFSIF